MTFRPGSVIGDADASDVNLWGFGRLLARGFQAGLLSLARSELHLAGWPLRGEAVVNVSRVTTGAIDTNWTGAATIALSHQALEFARWFREIVPRRLRVTDVGDTGIRLLAFQELRRCRHAPARHHELSASGRVAYDWCGIVRVDTGQRWHIARVIHRDAEQAPDRVLIRRYGVKIRPTSA
jgi:hypothetical protein